MEANRGAGNFINIERIEKNLSHWLKKAKTLMCFTQEFVTSGTSKNGHEKIRAVKTAA